MADLPGTFGRYPFMTDGIGGYRHCQAHVRFDITCDRCVMADRMNRTSWTRRTHSNPKPRKRRYAHDNPGTFCKCPQCWEKMRTIAERVL